MNYLLSLWMKLLKNWTEFRVINEVHVKRQRASTFGKIIDKWRRSWVANISKEDHKIKVVFGLELSYFGNNCIKSSVDVGWNKDLDVSPFVTSAELISSLFNHLLILKEIWGRNPNWERKRMIISWNKTYFVYFIIIVFILNIWFNQSSLS